MAKQPIPPTATEEEVRALLERYRCPVPFHEVRTRMLGYTAAEVMNKITPPGGSGKRLMTCPGAIVQSLCLRFAEWQVTEYKYRLPACSDVNI